MVIFTLILMIFFHIVDDYYLQGWLASAKQKIWWMRQENYSSMYKNDYIVALFMHSFSWSFMVMLPIAYNMNFNISHLFIIFFIANIIIHFTTDNLKANLMRINLVQDQSIHIAQILATFVVFTFL